MLDQGIHLDAMTSVYFADPAPSPSLTQSLAKIILAQSPRHAWQQHPRLNPDFHPDEDGKFNVGTVAHKLMIGRGKEVAVLGYDDWRTKAAKEEREKAQAEGKTAVLEHQFNRAAAMVKAAREQLELRKLSYLFREGHGHGEVVTVWQDGPIWCRQMLDWLSIDRLTVPDYKTTDMVAAPHALGRMMVNAGWPIQAAMADRGLAVLDPENAGRRRYLFVVQECEPPYQLNVAQMTEGALTMGHKQLDHAINIWADCIAANIFPGYPLEIVRPEYPGWAENQWLEREIENEQTKPAIPSDLLMAG